VVHAPAEAPFVISFDYRENLDNELAFRLMRIQDLAREGLVDPGLGILSVQAKLLLEHVMGITPPRTIKQGKDRVRIDLERIFRPLDPNKFRNQSIRKLIRAGDPVAWDNFSSRLREGELAQTRAIVPNERLHRSNRDKRGRAYRNPRPKMVTLKPDQEALKQLIIASQANVGYAKAGWVRAYTELGGDRAPEWVKRHFPGKGIFQDGRKGDNPFVAAYNQTGWGKKSDEAERIMNTAIKGRTNAMRSYFDTIGKMIAEGKLTPFQAQQQVIAEQFF
jgi:hypothetical protein